MRSMVDHCLVGTPDDAAGRLAVGCPGGARSQAGSLAGRSGSREGKVEGGGGREGAEAECAQSALSWVPKQGPQKAGPAAVTPSLFLKRLLHIGTASSALFPLFLYAHLLLHALLWLGGSEGNHVKSSAGSSTGRLLEPVEGSCSFLQQNAIASPSFFCVSLLRVWQPSLVGLCCRLDLHECRVRAIPVCLLLQALLLPSPP